MQLPLMGRIYQRASQIITWLGEPTHESNETFKFWTDVGNALLPHVSQPAFVQEMSERWRVPAIPAAILQQVNERRAQFAGKSKASDYFEYD